MTLTWSVILNGALQVKAPFLLCEYQTTSNRLSLAETIYSKYDGYYSIKYK